MTWPPILVDEDFPLAVARVLRNRSSSPVEITVEGARRVTTDEEQVGRAAAIGGVLLCHDRAERALFGEYARSWRRRGNESVSTLFLPRDADAGRLLQRASLLLDWYATRSDPKPETLIWNDVAQALIGGVRLPGYDDAMVRRALG